MDEKIRRAFAAPLDRALLGFDPADPEPRREDYRLALAYWWARRRWAARQRRREFLAVVELLDDPATEIDPRGLAVRGRVSGRVVVLPGLDDPHPRAFVEWAEAHLSSAEPDVKGEP